MPYHIAHTNSTGSGPGGGTERLPRRQHRLDSRILEVHRLRNDVITPPRRRVNVIEGERKENDERAEGEPEVEPGRREKVEAAPPAEVALLDEVLEDEADDAPGQVVERCGGRDGAGAAEDDGRDDVLERRLGRPLGGEVDDGGEDGADAEKDEQARVDLPRGEDSGWSEETPDDGG